ncbi:hypothetical protein HDU93_005241, partial [Gonapodya sp. JEL0774]
MNGSTLSSLPLPVTSKLTSTHHHLPKPLETTVPPPRDPPNGTLALCGGDSLDSSDDPETVMHETSAGPYPSPDTSSTSSAPSPVPSEPLRHHFLPKPVSSSTKGNPDDAACSRQSPVSESLSYSLDPAIAPPSPTPPRFTAAQTARLEQAIREMAADPSKGRKTVELEFEALVDALVTGRPDLLLQKVSSSLDSGSLGSGPTGHPDDVTSIDASVPTLPSTAPSPTVAGASTEAPGSPRGSDAEDGYDDGDGSYDEEDMDEEDGEEGEYEEDDDEYWDDEEEDEGELGDEDEDSEPDGADHVYDDMPALVPYDDGTPDCADAPPQQAQMAQQRMYGLQSQRPHPNHSLKGSRDVNGGGGQPYQSSGSGSYGNAMAPQGSLGWGRRRSRGGRGGPYSAMTAEDFSRMANTHRRANRLQEAASSYSSAMAVQPGNPYHIYNRALLHHQMSLWRRVISDVDLILPLIPSWTDLGGAPVDYDDPNASGQPHRMTTERVWMMGMSLRGYAKERVVSESGWGVASARAEAAAAQELANGTATYAASGPPAIPSTLPVLETPPNPDCDPLPPVLDHGMSRELVDSALQDVGCFVSAYNHLMGTDSSSSFARYARTYFQNRVMWTRRDLRALKGDLVGALEDGMRLLETLERWDVREWVGDHMVHVNLPGEAAAMYAAALTMNKGSDMLRLKQACAWAACGQVRKAWYAVEEMEGRWRRGGGAADFPRADGAAGGAPVQPADPQTAAPTTPQNDVVDVEGWLLSVPGISPDTFAVADGQSPLSAGDVLRRAADVLKKQVNADGTTLGRPMSSRICNYCGKREKKEAGDAATMGYRRCEKCVRVTYCDRECQSPFMSFIRRALRRLKTVADPLSTRRLVGEDLEGNQYYEVFPQGGLTASGKPKRVVEPVASVDHSDYTDTLPAPTKEELLAEVQRRKILEERVKALEEKYALERARRLESEQQQIEAAQLASATSAAAHPDAKSPATPDETLGLDRFPSGGSEGFKPGEWNPKSG